MRVVPPRRFAKFAPDLVHEPSGMRVWLTEPLGILTQLTEQTAADFEMAKFLSGPVSDRLFALRTTSDQQVLFFHEWSAMTGYGKGVRKEMTDWGLRIRKDIERIVVSLGPEAPSLVKMGVNVAASALTLAGIRLSLVADMDAMLDELDVGRYRARV